MADENNKDDNGMFDSLLDNVDELDDTDLEAEEGGEEAAPEGDKKKTQKVDYKDKFEKMEKSYKNNQEVLRQMSEDVKSNREWKDRIMGLDKQDKDAEVEKELRDKLDEDPLGTVRGLISDAVKEVKDDFEGRAKKTEQTAMSANFKKIVTDVDKEYIVDWDKDFNKIIPKLAYFSDLAKKEMPKEVLVQACRMAGVITRKEEGDIPFVEGSVGSRSAISIKNEAQKIREGIMGKKEKKLLDF